MFTEVNSEEESTNIYIFVADAFEIDFFHS